MTDKPEDARAVSRALFGNLAFAEVAASADAILAAGGPSSTVTTRQVAAATGCSDSVVRPVMLRLVAAGLLVAEPRSGPSNGVQRFSRSRSARWESLLGLLVDVDADGVNAEPAPRA